MSSILNTAVAAIAGNATRKARPLASTRSRDEWADNLHILRSAIRDAIEVLGAEVNAETLEPIVARISSTWTNLRVTKPAEAAEIRRAAGPAGLGGRIDALGAEAARSVSAAIDHLRQAVTSSAQMGLSGTREVLSVAALELPAGRAHARTKAYAVADAVDAWERSITDGLESAAARMRKLESIVVQLEQDPVARGILTAIRAAATEDPNSPLAGEIGQTLNRVVAVRFHKQLAAHSPLELVNFVRANAAKRSDKD